MVDFILQSTKLRAAFRMAASAIERDVLLDHLTNDEVDRLIAAILKADWKLYLPTDIAERLLATGHVEWGQTPALDPEAHGAHVTASCRLTDEYFGQQGDQHMHGLYPVGTNTVLCHTGTSPNSPLNARALAGAWNWLVDLAKADEEASHG
ncbi:hypothetical protein [uncultured Sphingomonas sp.]|uniref:hypothetical protein n=1 Tax=uncultured Sphingomonas sp. TaxID=158754 RepID=UPI0025F6368B|nr:hypothetical protein [uncultured Sphingomonas sp.]